MRFLGSNLGQLAWWQAYLPANILHSVTSHQPRQTWVIKQVREGQYVSSKALSIKTMKFLLGDLGVPTHSRATEHYDVKTTRNQVEKPTWKETTNYRLLPIAKICPPYKTPWWCIP